MNIHPQVTPLCCIRHSRGKNLQISALDVKNEAINKRSFTFLDIVTCTKILPWVLMSTHHGDRLDIVSNGSPSMILIELFSPALYSDQG